MASQHISLVFISIFITLGTLASHATSRAILFEASLAEKHEQWMAKHGRVYPDAEEKERRFAIFKKNVEYVEKFNNEGNKTYKLSINKFSDMTNEEFRRHHTGFKMAPGLSSTSSSSNFSHQSLAATDIPTRMDWREKQAVTPIKDQGPCGACWAFAVAATVEGLTKLKTGKLISLSEQQQLDCNIQNYGCSGGNLEMAYTYVKNEGLAREESYPYKSTDMETCDTNKESQHAAQITGYEHVPSNSENELLKAVAMQPVTISIAAYGYEFQHYSTGVFSSEDCGTDLDHAVTAIGYGTTEGGIPYWLLKNSWGKDSWGESGYMRILRNSGAPEGLCGLAMNSFYPTA